MVERLDLDELLDGALEDFREVPQPSAAGPRNAGSGSAPSAAARSAPDGSSNTPPPEPGQGESRGRGPSLPPRAKQRKGGQVATQSAQRPAGSRASSQPPAQPPLDAAHSQAPDLAATLAALAQSGGGSDGAAAAAAASSAPDLSETLRAAAAATASSRWDGPIPEGDSDALLKELTEQLQGMGPDSGDPEQTNSFVNGIMRQLLSKEVLHQSMKDIGVRYPAWLDANAGTLSEADLARYSQQHRHIVDICNLYEADPGNFPAIYDKLQQMQSCGTPPDDIVQELSPGLQFDGEGLPQMPGGAPGCCIQ